MARRRPSARGSSILEIMIAMAVIAVGLLAMWNLHMVGITSTAAGRRHTVGMALAQELASGLERLPFNSAQLVTPFAAQGSTDPPPTSAPFGSFVESDGSIRSMGFTWDDSSMAAAIPGVRTDAALREKADAAGYTRRWTVWDLISSNPAAAGTKAGVKVIAVSVTWRDPPFARPREVLVYTYVIDPHAVVAGLVSTL